MPERLDPLADPKFSGPSDIATEECRRRVKRFRLPKAVVTAIARAPLDTAIIQAEADGDDFVFTLRSTQYPWVNDGEPIPVIGGCS